jgi:hypothetical protein
MYNLVVELIEKRRGWNEEDEGNLFVLATTIGMHSMEIFEPFRCLNLKRPLACVPLNAPASILA